MPSERIQKRIDRLLDQADEAADARDWASVREVSLSVIGVDPDNEDAKAFLEMAEPHVEDADTAYERASLFTVLPSDDRVALTGLLIHNSHRRLIQGNQIPVKL